jgi:hypothetical protein
LLELEGDEQRAEEAQRKLQKAGMKLGLALASMGAACHIALRGGGGAPSSAPLFDSVDDLAGDLDVRRALERLDEAEVLATDVHDRVEAHPRPPGSGGAPAVHEDRGGRRRRGHPGRRPVGAQPLGRRGVQQRHGAPLGRVEGGGTRRRDHGRDKGGFRRQRQHRLRSRVSKFAGVTKSPSGVTIFL